MVEGGEHPLEVAILLSIFGSVVNGHTDRYNHEWGHLKLALLAESLQFEDVVCFGPYLIWVLGLSDKRYRVLPLVEDLLYSIVEILLSVLDLGYDVPFLFLFML